METVSTRQFQPFEQETLTITRSDAEERSAVWSARRYSRIERGSGDSSRYLFVFDEPESVRGVVFLIRKIEGGLQGHWVYLPALGPWMQRLGGGGGQAGILDTDFTAEDLTDEDIQQTVYQRKPDVMYHKRPHFLVEARSMKSDKRTESLYGFRRIYIDREYFRINRIDLYDRSGALLKRRFNLGHKKTGSVWRPDMVRMENIQTGSHTTVKTSQRFFSEDRVPEDFFSRDKIVKGILMEKKKREPGLLP
ncbi:MAG: outer membrane lipoprotein-sorting protein [Magnetococcales bacterium]|nr:outer membrane lipoprotein-sorting protein [Magnetococcales bacterium]